MRFWWIDVGARDFVATPRQPRAAAKPDVHAALYAKLQSAPSRATARCRIGHFADGHVLSLLPATRHGKLDLYGVARQNTQGRLPSVTGNGHPACRSVAAIADFIPRIGRATALLRRRRFCGRPRPISAVSTRFISRIVENPLHDPLGHPAAPPQAPHVRSGSSCELTQG